MTVNTPWCFCHFDNRNLCVCACVCVRTCVSVCHQRGCARVCMSWGGVDDLLWSSPGRHQHSIIPDLPDDTSRENTLPVSCRLVFFCCLLFIIFRAALPQGQVTICILFLQVFSKLSGVFIFIYFFIFFAFFQPFFFCCSVKGDLLMVFNPYMSPFADDSAGMVSERN